MNNTEIFDSGLDELEKQLSEFVKGVDKPLEVLKVGAKLLVEDVRKLPKPRSSMRGAGYTHLLDTVTYKAANDEIEVGWGKYYGPMKERGTKKMSATPHLAPTFQTNKEKYYKKMMDKFYEGGK